MNEGDSSRDGTDHPLFEEQEAGGSMLIDGIG